MLMQERPQRPTISVIIPARNEGGNLPFVLPHIPFIVSEVVLVDGHSIDDTVAVARQLLPSIRIVKQEGKGKGDAIRAGIAASTGDIIVMLDADGSADPNEISSFVEAIMTGNDFAKGSRFAKGGGSHDLTLIVVCRISVRFCRFITFHRIAFDQPVERINTIQYETSPDT